MASSQPVIVQIRWISMIPKLLVCTLIIFILSIFELEDPLFSGAILYFLISFFVKRLIPGYHRKGAKYIRNKQYSLAIDEFTKSYNFFKRYKWLDKYRALFLLSSSRISYSEMALVNIAYCYGQIGEGKQSQETYERALKEFPNSEIAKSALRMYNSIKNIN